MFSRMSPAFERFPYDIFREIMLHTYVDTLKLPQEVEFDIEVLSPPIPASHVCRSWRRALLLDPTMWTSLIFPEMGPEWIMELLRRSDSSLLDVSLFIYQDAPSKMNYDETSNVLLALFQQIHRFRILRVQVDVWYSGSPPDSVEVLAQQAVSYLQRPAPELQSLSFWYNYLDLDPGSIPNYTVIKKLFSGDAPRLERLHHRLSRDFEELGCPVFHNLSELRLTLVFDLNFGRFLNLLALSPRLKLLHLDVDSESYNLLAYFEQPSDRKVGLPFLEKLVFEVDFMIGLMDFVLKHVTLPSSIQWHIASRHYPGLVQSPSVSQFLSQAHFTSLHIRALPSFAQLTFEETLNDNHINRFIIYINQDIQDLVDLWDPLTHAFKSSSRITHMELEIGYFSRCFDIFPRFFTSMLNLKSLVIRPGIAHPGSGADGMRFLCLAALLPDFQYLIRRASHNNNTTSATDSIQNLEHNNNPSMFTTPAFPCPLLREVTLELHDSLETQHADFLYTISGLRRKAGYPFQIHVCCSQIKQGVEEMLELLELNDSSKISVSQIYAV